MFGFMLCLPPSLQILHQLRPTLRGDSQHSLEFGIHNGEKVDGKKHIQVDIYFTGAGMVDIPTENEMIALMNKICSTKNTEIPV